MRQITLKRVILSLALFCGAAVLLRAVVLAAFPGEAVEKTLSVDGRERTFLVYVPETKADKPRAVVLALHGGGGNGRQMERYSRLNQTAKAHGFIVIYPDAVEANWNDGRGMDFIRAQKENIDDVKFLRAAVDAVAGETPIDRSRVFATGISNGAFMSHRLATEASDLVAAVAPVVGGMAPAMAEKFAPTYPVSILLIQGDADPLVPIGGGEVRAMGKSRGKTVPIADALAKYVARNGNQGDPVVTTQDNKPDDSTTVEFRKYADGAGGAKTHYYLIKQGGHTWPGRPLYLPEAIIGKASQEFSASDVIWEFFNTCPPRKAK
jgi:polyhydroxybutyrate depolymerase